MLDFDRPDARLESRERLDRALALVGAKDLIALCTLLVDGQAMVDGAPMRDRIGTLRTMLGAVASVYEEGTAGV